MNYHYRKKQNDKTLRLNALATTALNDARMKYSVGEKGKKLVVGGPEKLHLSLRKNKPFRHRSSSIRTSFETERSITTQRRPINKIARPWHVLVFLYCILLKSIENSGTI